MKNRILTGLLSLALLAVASTQDWGMGPYDFTGTLNPLEYPDSDKSDTLGACWMSSYARVTHKPLSSSCPKGQTLMRSTCYDPCPAGYSANTASDTSDEINDNPQFGSDSSDIYSFCWQDCPSDLTIEGKNCIKPAPEYVWTQYANESLCEEYNPQGCEFCEYPGGWVGTTDCGHCETICPVTCPESMTQNGLFCERHHFNRTGFPLECSKGLVLDVSNTLCYTPQKENFTCTGDLCLGPCPHGWEMCGALCIDGSDCGYSDSDDSYYTVGTNALNELKTLAAKVKNATQGGNVNVAHIKLPTNITYPMCH